MNGREIFRRLDKDRLDRMKENGEMTFGELMELTRQYPVRPTSWDRPPDVWVTEHGDPPVANPYA